ncbi:hypothetical protein QQE94_00605 [Fervidobacterium pennivorans subsp. shakshaketiis]|uniref:hypothetical protein n=1 Tax=Fervidobacterium pennivorans TaxID=93466 RepID=UPI00355C0808
MDSYNSMEVGWNVGLKLLLEKCIAEGIDVEKDVERYLSVHPDMIEVVDFAITESRKQFPDARLRLAVYRDPESGEESLTLYVKDSDELTLVEEKLLKITLACADYLYNKSGWLSIMWE